MEGRNLRIDYRWAVSEIDNLRPSIKELVGLNPDAIITRVRDLAKTMTDAQIVAELNRCGERSATGRRHTVHTIAWIRWKYEIPAPTLKRPEEWTVKDLAAKVADGTVVLESVRVPAS